VTRARVVTVRIRLSLAGCPVGTEATERWVIPPAAIAAVPTMFARRKDALGNVQSEGDKHDLRS
jgi:hypothetical protein